MKSDVQRYCRLPWPVVSVTAVVLVWWAMAWSGRISPYLLPSPYTVARRLVTLLTSGEAIKQSVVTLLRTLAGLGLAIAVGSVIGLWMGRSRRAEWAFEPVVSILFPTPKIAFLPIFILWFGAFDLSKILIAAFICAFPVITACQQGVRDMDTRLSWVGRNFGMSERRIFWKIVLPACIPALLNGAEVALPFAFIAITVSEMIAGGGGIGASMMLAARFADSTTVFGWLIVLAAMGALLTIAARAFRENLLRWHTEVDARR